jgi:hypothetical protein
MGPPIHRFKRCVQTNSLKRTPFGPGPFISYARTCYLPAMGCQFCGGLYFEIYSNFEQIYKFENCSKLNIVQILKSSKSENVQTKKCSNFKMFKSEKCSNFKIVPI